MKVRIVSDLHAEFNLPICNFILNLLLITLPCKTLKGNYFKRRAGWHGLYLAAEGHVFDAEALQGLFSVL